MNRYFRLCAFAILAACGGAGYAPPSNLDNACAIARERPSWYSDMQRAERKWGVPIHVQMATIHQESKFDGKARTPYRFALGIIPMGRQSSAYGYSQAIDGTWDDYRTETRNRGAKRDRFDDAVDFMGWYMDKTEKKLGLSKWDARNQYLAYHEGHSGYSRGSYKSKTWLVRVAGEVSARADTYLAQLITCS